MNLGPRDNANTDGRLSRRRVIYLGVSRWRVKEVFVAGLSVLFPAETSALVSWRCHSRTPSCIYSSYSPRELWLSLVWESFPSTFSNGATVGSHRRRGSNEPGTCFLCQPAVSFTELQQRDSPESSWQCPLAGCVTAGTGLEILRKHATLHIRGDRLGNSGLLLFPNLFTLATGDSETRLWAASGLKMKGRRNDCASC